VFLPSPASNKSQELASVMSPVTMASSLGSLEPLERRTLAVDGPNGMAKTRPALHAAWIEQGRAWAELPPWVPTAGSAAQAKDGVHEEAKVAAWRQAAELVAEDLHVLLTLEAHSFWSQIIYDGTLNRKLTRLLQTLPRAHDYGHPSEANLNALDLVMRPLFLVFVRLATHKESKKDFFTAEGFGRVIYDNFVFDVPRLMDLAALFRPCSPRIVQKMLANVFACQPAYIEDLTSAAGQQHPT